MRIEVKVQLDLKQLNGGIFWVVLAKYITTFKWMEAWKQPEKHQRDYKNP